MGETYQITISWVSTPRYIYRKWGLFNSDGDLWLPILEKLQEGQISGVVRGDIMFIAWWVDGWPPVSIKTRISGSYTAQVPQISQDD